MSQKQFLTDLDADLHVALADAGMADTGTYTAPGADAEAVPVRAYVDKGVAIAGEYAPTFGAETTITLLRADVAQPVAGATVALDGETYTLRVVVDEDDGISKWVCE